MGWSCRWLRKPCRHHYILVLQAPYFKLQRTFLALFITTVMGFRLILIGRLILGGSKVNVVYSVLDKNELGLWVLILPCQWGFSHVKIKHRTGRRVAVSCILTVFVACLTEFFHNETKPVKDLIPLPFSRNGFSNLFAKSQLLPHEAWND